MTRNLEKCLKLVEEDRAITSPAAKGPYYPLVVKKGRGAVIEDVDGNCYIDLLSSAGAINTGHCHPRVVDAIKKQAEDLILYTHVYMYHEPIINLTKELISISPGDYRKRVYYGLSGVSLPMHRGLGPLLPEIYHVPYPDPYRPPVPGMTPDQVSDYCIDYIRTAFENHIPADEVAAVFFEPIQGDAGLVVPPAKFVRDLRALCDKHGILLFSEEVQQGFGRTGKWFGIENFDVVPDAIILGKAIASEGCPN